MERRRFVIGLATVVLGGSGFVASGAVDVDSLGSSGGAGWVALAEPDVAEVDDIAVDDDEPDDEEEDPDADEERGEVRVQAIVDRSGGGSNRGEWVPQAPTVVHSDFVRTNDDGLLAEIDLHSMNPNATTRVGRLDGSGEQPQDQEVAFMIANVGGLGVAGDPGRRVRVTLLAFADEAGEETFEPNGLRFPWALDRNNAGENLIGEMVELRQGNAIGVSIVLDGNAADRNTEALSLIGLGVETL